MQVRRLGLVLVLALFVGGCASSPRVIPLALAGEVMPGGLMRGKAEGAAVFFNDTQLTLSKEGFFAFGFGRNSGGKMMVLEARWPSGETVRREFSVPERLYPVQRIDGLSDAAVNPPPEVWPRLAAERAAKQKARENRIAGLWFREQFQMPVVGIITGAYGTARILNGEPRQPHGGIDIAAAKGTPVLAPAGGRVMLAEKDFYFEGGLIFLDHGGEIMSAFLHLAELAVVVGQNVTQGEVIGFVGASGRATGPHLDWRLYWRRLTLDPVLAVPPAQTGRANDPSGDASTAIARDFSAP